MTDFETDLDGFYALSGYRSRVSRKRSFLGQPNHPPNISRARAALARLSDLEILARDWRRHRRVSDAVNRQLFYYTHRSGPSRRVRVAPIVLQKSVEILGEQ